MKPSAMEPDDIDKKIIECIKKGDTYKEVSSKIYKSVPVVKYRLSVLKKYYGCRSVKELVLIDGL